MDGERRWGREWGRIYSVHEGIVGVLYACGAFVESIRTTFFNFPQPRGSPSKKK